MLRIRTGSLLFDVDFVLDFLHAFFSFFSVHLLLGVDFCDFSLRLSLDARLGPLSSCLLLRDLLFLLGDLKRSLLCFYLFVVLHESLRDAGLGHSDGNDLNAGGPLAGSLLESLRELLVQRVELVDKDLLQGGLTAELVDLVVDFVEDPGFVVLCCVVFHGFEGQRFLKSVHNLNLFKGADDAP